jgi:uncharacterized protein
MIWPTIISGFAIGLAGSLHCVGMCGPLALALPVQHLSVFKRINSLLLYQLGRITTYSLLGFLFGLLGRRIYLAGFQQGLSIGLGVLVLVSAIVYFVKKRTVHLNFLNIFYGMVQRAISHLLRSNKGPATFFLLGTANGFLPCGMVYMAVAGALSSISVTHSVLFMSMFGAGTLPAMMAVSCFGHAMPMSVRLSMRKAVPYIITAMALILILRGLNLGIPYISPEMPSAAKEAVSCHA